ncbi:MAG TPA: polysaccharide export protein, partial [Aquificaceae bacterium]|nr:polysaccharide export protein [Aquificaceae bacterium]
EVRKPGIYRLEKGMRLYDIIMKAGGFTENAYPRGLIFIRESAKELQEQHLKIAITALEEGLLKADEGLGTVGGTSEERMIIQLTLNKQRELLRIIKEKAKIGLGRIALDIPERLEDLRNSPSNILLEDGDYIYIPPRPNYILVLGEVYNQISLPYIKGKPLSYYLELVGGTTPNADLENIYVIKANGRVISRRNYNELLSFEWNNGKLYFGRDFMDMPLEEGDTIVVPTKLKIPVLWRPLIRDVVQIIFQAISTAVLAKRL